jgi:hypothetical protein
MNSQVLHSVDRNNTIHTSQIANEVVEFHLALRFDAYIVKVSVEHNDGERQQKHGVN